MAKIAVVGVGHWGKNHIKTFNGLGVLNAVVEVKAELRENITADYPDVKVFDNLDAVISDASIKGVSVATPAETHYAIAKKLLEGGKNVLVEKPITLDSIEAEYLTKLADDKGLILMVGHVMLYHPAITRIKEMIDAGELGNLQYIYSNRLNLGAVRKEENVLWSFAPHDISIINYFTSSIPIDVHADGSAFLQPAIYDSTLTHLKYPNNVHAHIFVSWLHPFKEHRLTVIGDKAMVVFEDSRKDEKLVLYPKYIEWVNGEPVKREEDAVVVEYTPAMPLTEECRTFVECIDKGVQPLTDGRNGVEVLKVLERAQRKMTPESSKEEAPKLAYFVHPSAYVDQPNDIGAGTKVWHFSHVMKNTKIGKNCIFGQNVNIDSGVIIGNNVKVQNNVSIYTGLIIEDDVFLGPSCVMTNVTNPRSQVLRHSLYEKTILKRGCSVGANSTIVCGITVGRYAFIGAGAVVPKDVPDYAMVVGVPARQIGWVSRHGLPLKNADADGVYTCPESGLHYKEVEPGVMRCLDLDEEAPLPENLRMGEVYYDDIVHPELKSDD